MPFIRADLNYVLIRTGVLTLQDVKSQKKIKIQNLFLTYSIEYTKKAFFRSIASDISLTYTTYNISVHHLSHVIGKSIDHKNLYLK